VKVPLVILQHPFCCQEERATIPVACFHFLVTTKVQQSGNQG